MPHAAEHVHHFAMGSWLLFFAYVVSVVGCVVGLACTLQARNLTGRARLGWLVAAAVSIGGVGIWLMHFIAMLGFDTPGFPVRYDLGRTALSALLSISATFVGLVVFGVRKRYSVPRLVAGGIIMGLAVNLMHYTGMWAIQIQGTSTYNSTLVWLSIAIAVVAATAALWFTVIFDSTALRLVAGMVMGVAVTGMHYTGMAAIEVTIDPTAPPPGGVEVFTFLFPVFVLAVLALAVPIYAVLMASTWYETTAKPEDVEDIVPVSSSTSSKHRTQALGQGVRGVGQLANRFPTQQERPPTVEQPKRTEQPGRPQEQPDRTPIRQPDPTSSRPKEPLPTRRPAGR
ncbi:NO-binding membrane sensor protein with MHYT domain [Actinophytocola oryzae]|uniref:NO-binding membrane sensor protein with MHYT domain n=1 Tax=Actinophytocola oryzae TaxID=502181 RepID=A0A4R7VY81_9PSEU|nr:NO-binding membrane sensor protein with MHYT domain [Actinophytocola oryzae]